MQYTLVVFFIGCLLGAPVGWTLATEDSHFNQYINTKLVSDYSAVLHTITSVADCLAYLKDNKHTHKVVAFDARTQKCSGVLQTLAYEVQPEAGWTTFEITEAVDSSTTSNTARNNSLPTRALRAADNKTTGICEDGSGSIYLPYHTTSIISVYSYDFNLCTNFGAAKLFNVSNNCSSWATIYASNINLKVSIDYDIGEFGGYLQLSFFGRRLIFTKKGSYSGTLRTTEVVIEFVNWGNTPIKGFCMSVTPTEQRPAETRFETKAETEIDNAD